MNVSKEERDSLGDLPKQWHHAKPVDGMEDAFVSPSSISLVFDSMGILEQILSFVDTTDLQNSTAVNRRWKEAGRTDALWQAVIRRTWHDKKGVSSDRNMIFWRSLFNKERVRRMTQDDVLCMFRHPFLYAKYKALEEEIAKQETSPKVVDTDYLQRSLQMHMLDVISEGNDADESHPRIFFSDLYFGSFASSILDSRRSTIILSELCTPFGFDMHFKLLEEDADEWIVENNEDLRRYDEAEGILLYKHSTCSFCPDRDFRIVLRPNVAPTYRPSELRWRWIEFGKQIQVGPYPSLTVTRRKDWGWKLENLHVVMYSHDGDGLWPPSRLNIGDNGWSSDSSESSNSLTADGSADI
jgi:hypothetical protein